MVWRVELSKSAQKSLAGLGAVPAGRVLRFIVDRLEKAADPRSLGKPLTASRLGELWRYRDGDDRIVTRIEDGVLRILVVRIAHRRDVYRDLT